MVTSVTSVTSMVPQKMPTEEKAMADAEARSERCMMLAGWLAARNEQQQQQAGAATESQVGADLIEWLLGRAAHAGTADGAIVTS